MILDYVLNSSSSTVIFCGKEKKKTLLVNMSEVDKFDEKKPIKYAQYDGTLSEEAHDKQYMELTLKSGKHSDLVKKLLRQRIEQRAKEFPRWPASQTHGVRSIWIESRFWYDRERLLPEFDSDWRSYRVKYLQSLELHPHEPIHVPEYETHFLNPLRRFYMKGGDFLEYKIIRRFTDDKYRSALYRVVITRGIMLYLAFVAGYYTIRYNNRTWMDLYGPEIGRSAPIMHEGHPKYPFQDYRTEPHHHYDQYFTRRNIYKDLRDFETCTNVI